MSSEARSQKLLAVPYRRQCNEWACGLAAFEMVSRYLGKASGFSQKVNYRRLASADPHNKGEFLVRADDVINVAMYWGLLAGWGRISLDRDEMRSQIEHFLYGEGVPLIACQRYSDEQPTTGHFRVIVGMEGENVMFHDPCRSIGGSNMRWPLERFRERWETTSLNVTGGVAVWITSRRLENVPLAPDLPNLWAREISPERHEQALRSLQSS